MVTLNSGFLLLDVEVTWTNYVCLTKPSYVEPVEPVYKKK